MREWKEKLLAILFNLNVPIEKLRELRQSLEYLEDEEYNEN